MPAPTPTAVCHFAETLRNLLAERTAGGIERRWVDTGVERDGWRALARARRADVVGLDAALDEVDGLLLRLLDRLPALARDPDDAGRRLATFRIPVLERLQHAAAAVLVAHRYGLAGLRTVIADGGAPLGRRYYAYLTLADRHPRDAWPEFARYLIPVAHHAFVGVAAEAARFYPEHGAARHLTALFEAVRSDLHLRAFLSPRILESLYVLADPATLPFHRDLLVSGHTAPDPEYCEVTHALVMVRRFTGRVEPSAKFPRRDRQAVDELLDEAEAAFEEARDVLSPVVVI